MSMGGTIGTASITVEADAKNFANDVQKQTEGPIAKTGTSLGRTISDTMGVAFNIGARAIGTSVAAILGAAVVGGFNRLKAIDTAETKLAALGNTTAEVEQIMKDTTDAVTGTAFSLDEAATSAAGFSAAGVAIEDIGPALTNMANLAEIGGTSLKDLDEVFRDMAVGASISLSDIERLEQRGVPAMTLLADAFGVSQAAVSEMVTNGEIDFATFNEVLNESLGDVAKGASTSFAGSMRQVITAINRLGAAFLDPVFEGMKVLLPAIAHAFNEILEVVIPLAEKMAGPVLAGFEKLADVLLKIDLKGFADGLSGIGDAIVPLLPLILAFLGPLLTKIPVIGGMFKGLTPVIGATMGALILLFAVDPSTLARGFEKLGEIIPKVLDKIVEALLAFVTTVLPALAAKLIENLQVIVEGLLNLVVTLIPIIAQALATLLPALITTLLSMIPQLLAAAVQLFLTIVQAIPVILPLLLEGILSIIGPVVAAILEGLPAVLSAAIELFFQLVTGVIENLPAILEAILGLLPPILAAIVSMIPDILTAAVQLFFAIVMGVLENIGPLIDAVIGLIPVVVSTLVSALPQILAAAIQLFGAIVTGIIQNIGPITRAIITEVIPAAVRAIIEAVPQMVRAGIDLMKGLAQGILDGVSSVVSAITGAVGKAIQAGKDLLGIGSPSKVFDTIGRQTIQGYVRGVDALAGKAADAVGRAMPTSGGFSFAGGGVPVISGGIGGFGTPTGGGSTTNNSTGAMFAEGSIQVFEADNAAATAVGVVDRIAERVAL